MRNRLQHIPLGALRAPCFPCKIYPHICLGARRAAGAPGVPGIQKKCERGIPAREICKSRTYVKKNPPAAVARSINISGKTLFVLRALGHAWPVLNLSGRTSGWKGAAFLARSEPSRKHLQVERATSLARARILEVERAAFLARSRPCGKDRRAERAAFLARSRPSRKELRSWPVLDLPARTCGRKGRHSWPVLDLPARTCGRKGRRSWPASNPLRRTSRREGAAFLARSQP